LEYKDTKARGREYLVKWLGWLVEHSTWELANNLNYCEDILREYLSNLAVALRSYRGRALGNRRLAVAETSYSLGLEV
jgi:hypothetical protein